MREFTTNTGWSFGRRFRILSHRELVESIIYLGVCEEEPNDYLFTKPSTTSAIIWVLLDPICFEDPVGKDTS
jgi:hypothetical protein